LQAQIEVEQARILLQNAGNRQQAAWQTLSAVVGQPLPVQRLEGTLDRTQPVLTWDDTLARLLGQSPEVAAAVVNVERAQLALRRARAEPTPNITVEGIVQYDNAIDSSDGNLQVTLPVPLLNRNQGGIREARARLTGAQQALERVEAGISQRLSKVFERYANAQNQVERYSSEILPAAERSFELTREGYRSGEFGFLTLLTALRTLFHTKLAYLEAQRELWVSASEIEGMLLTNSLELGP
jgi:cobalt-zinc-cadmium efflux system outer membrane protein